jgi:hypothetical protein
MERPLIVEEPVLPPTLPLDGGGEQCEQPAERRT